MKEGMRVGAYVVKNGALVADYTAQQRELMGLNRPQRVGSKWADAHVALSAGYSVEDWESYDRVIDEMSEVPNDAPLSPASRTQEKRDGSRR
jgi:hypothetical protein